MEDAEKCISLNQNFARGYQRKGTALFYLDKLEDAAATYKQGLQIDPNNAALKNDLKAAEDKISQETSGFEGMNFGGQNQNPQFQQQYLSALMKLMQNPETKDLISEPSFMQKIQLIIQNPAAAQIVIQQDPRFKKVVEVLSSDAPSNFNFEDMMKNMGKGAQQEQAPPKK